MHSQAVLVNAGLKDYESKFVARGALTVAALKSLNELTLMSALGLKKIQVNKVLKSQYKI